MLFASSSFQRKLKVCYESSISNIYVSKIIKYGHLLTVFQKNHLSANPNPCSLPSPYSPLLNSLTFCNEYREVS